jgi:DNA-directed RNA polymerase specialized sigma24 family protein
MNRLRLVAGETSGSTSSRQDPFDTFVASNGGRLRAALVARYGVEMGCDAHAEALGWAWQNWDRLVQMDNPVGYLYRVAQSSTRSHRRWFTRHSFPARMPERWHVDADATLMQSLDHLTESQRVAVLMVHGHLWSYAEVAEVLGCSVGAVTNHVHRGLAAMRRQLAEEQS